MNRTMMNKPTRQNFGLGLAALTLIWIAAAAAVAHAADSTTGGQAHSNNRLSVITWQYQDHMVLQRDMPIPISGKAAPEARVTVSFKGQKKETVADAGGKWRVALDPMPADKQSAVMTIESAGERIEIKDILVGDVWFCSGQSNMFMALYWLKSQKNRPPEQYESQKVLRETSAFPHIRLYKTMNGNRAGDIPGGMEPDEWSLYTTESAKEFSMVSLYFARELAQAIPIGLIQVAIGGAPADVFMSREVLETLPYMKWRLRLGDRLRTPGYSDEDRKQWRKEILAEQQKEWDQIKQQGGRASLDPGGVNYWSPKTRQVGNLPSDKWPAVEQWTSFPIKGAIWYQGEADSHDAIFYAETMSALIASWRKAWKQGDFPFLVVQLPGYKKKQTKPNEGDWAEIREQQADIVKMVSNTGMVVTYDSGEENDIHPYDKDVPGKRLALLARKMVYGENIVASGPIFKSMTVDGNKATLTFDSVGGALTTRNEEPLQGFAVQVKSPEPPNRESWEWAKAEIVGNTVVLTSESGAGPIQAVRYAWASFPIGNLYNKENLPAAPFRTDR
jgi:sialate O-acetylesterase